MRRWSDLELLRRRFLNADRCSTNLGKSRIVRRRQRRPSRTTPGRDRRRTERRFCDS